MKIRHFKKIIIGILCVTIAVVILLKLSQPTPQASLLEIQSPVTAIEADTIEPETIKPEPIKSESASVIVAAPKEQALTQQAMLKKNEDDRMAALIKQRLTPEMRAEINARLNPPNQNYTEIETAQGGYVNLGHRAASVAIAFIDEEGNTVVTDITESLADE